MAAVAAVAAVTAVAAVSAVDAVAAQLQPVARRVGVTPGFHFFRWVGTTVVSWYQTTYPRTPIKRLQVYEATYLRTPEKSRTVNYSLDKE